MGDSMNKRYNLYLAIVFLAIPQYFIAMMPYYQNKITNIEEIDANTTYTLVITCDQLEPIALYAPATFQESQESSEIRIFMPHTTLAEGIAEVPGVLDQTSSGVSILLVGKLVKKIITDHKVYIIIQKIL